METNKFLEACMLPSEPFLLSTPSKTTVIDIASIKSIELDGASLRINMYGDRVITHSFVSIETAVRIYSELTEKLYGYLNFVPWYARLWRKIRKII